MGKFSGNTRLERLKIASLEEFDLLVIGGGITGAGIALDAAVRGLKVVLVEKNDFASGTSSGSTKLIHGGLRYLKELQFGVVRQTGHERAILHRNAPHLVKPEPMLLPIVKGGSLGLFSTRLALWVYETLAGVKRHERFKMLNKQESQRIEPLLNENGLLGSAKYTEYRTDDARLCISVMKTAAERGAMCFNYVEAIQLIYAQERIAGAEVKDSMSGFVTQLKAKCVINAAGPWVDAVRRLEGEIHGKQLVLSKGIHVVIDHERFPVKQSVYFDTPDGRMVFAIPREGKTYLGTTDTLHQGSPEMPRVTEEDINYLKQSLNLVFPNIQLSRADMKSSWTGLRPLIGEPGKGTGELSRKDEIFISKRGLISMAGGKLTGYRVMAKKAVDLALKQDVFRADRRPKSSTIQVKITGGDFDNLKQIEEYIERQSGEAKQVGISPKLIRLWVNRYGRSTEHIVEKAYEIWPKIEQKSLVAKLAELHYAIDEEMMVLPGDFWIRRTGDGWFRPESVYQEFQELFPHFTAMMGYSQEQASEMEYHFLGELDSMLLRG